MSEMILKSLPINFLKVPTPECIHLLSVYKRCPDINHTEYLIARQLLLMRLTDELQDCVDHAINTGILSDCCCVTFYRNNYPKIGNYILEPGGCYGTN